MGVAVCNDRHRRAAAESGATCVTSATNWCSPGCCAPTRPAAPLPARCPSGRSQSRRQISEGTDETSAAARQSGAQVVKLGKAGNCVNATSTACTVLSGACAIARRSPAMAFSGSPCGTSEGLDRSAPARTAPRCGSRRGSPAGASDGGNKVGDRIPAASAISASFEVCSSGTKLSIVSTFETVGSCRSFVASSAPPHVSGEDSMLGVDCSAAGVHQVAQGAHRLGIGFCVPSGRINVSRRRKRNRQHNQCGEAHQDRDMPSARARIGASAREKPTSALSSRAGRS